ncbi:hypothetical protein ACFFGV_13515 [Pontibacillus salicampi]|uniref:DUF3953 domain-containing protein n=1 Tax=Pontibacillus salicampi TaxID=1449801 RepID=A0ABV6LQ96_9BACI
MKNTRKLISLITIIIAAIVLLTEAYDWIPLILIGSAFSIGMLGIEEYKGKKSPRSINFLLVAGLNLVIAFVVWSS